jgi:hypothetical protein
MEKRKTLKIWASLSAVLLFVGLGVFHLSVYLGKQTSDPDAYEILGFFAMLGIIFWAIITGCIALGIWLSQRNKTLELFTKS